MVADLTAQDLESFAEVTDKLHLHHAIPTFTLRTILIGLHVTPETCSHGNSTSRTPRSRKAELISYQDLGRKPGKSVSIPRCINPTI